MAKNKLILLDYAYLYFGCYMINTSTSEIKKLSHHTYSELIYNDKLQLLLRPINDLKQHEYISMGVRSDVEIEETKNINDGLIKSMAHQVKYICARGVDVFNLINQNAAINVNEINIENPYDSKN